MSFIYDKRINVAYLLVSILAAVLLWYSVNAREMVERVVEVRLDYKGLPQGLVVTAGQLNKINVRLRAPLELLRSMSGREMSYTMDLAGVTKGTNIIPFNWDNEHDLRAFQVIEVIPPRLSLEVDNILETRLPVLVRFRESPLAASLRMEDVVVEPSQVTVRGPAIEVSKLRRLMVEVPVDLNAENQTITDEVPVVAPPSVEVIPTTVKVKRLITVQRRNMSLQRDVLTDWGDGQVVNVQNPRVTLVVSVPRSATNDGAYLAQIQVSLSADLLPEGESAAAIPVKVSLPAGARLMKISPEEVNVTRHIPATETSKSPETPKNVTAPATGSAEVNGTAAAKASNAAKAAAKTNSSFDATSNSNLPKE